MSPKNCVGVGGLRGSGILCLRQQSSGCGDPSGTGFIVHWACVTSNGQEEAWLAAEQSKLWAGTSSSQMQLVSNDSVAFAQ